MSPSLPLELQQAIINFALDVAPSRARQRDRHAFLSVNSQWRASIEPWKAVDVFGVAQLGRLNGTLMNAKLVGRARFSVRSLYLELDDDADGVRALAKTVGLVGLVQNLEKVEIVMVWGVLGQGHRLDGALQMVLATCDRMTDLVLRGLAGQRWLDEESEVHSYIRARRAHAESVRDLRVRQSNFAQLRA